MRKTITKLNRVVEEFGAGIVRGTYAAGTGLPPEVELCKDYGLSRATLREVVKVLAAKKLIHVQPHCGLSVVPQEKWNYLDADVLRWRLAAGDCAGFIGVLLETRRLVEPAIADWAAQRASGADLAELEAALNEMDALYADKDAFNLADLRFHQALLASAHNVVIEQLGEALSTLQRAVFDVTYFPDATTRDITIRQHRALYDAIRLRNARLARKISIEMIQGVEARIEAKFRPHRAPGQAGLAVSASN